MNISNCSYCGCNITLYSEKYYCTESGANGVECANCWCSNCNNKLINGNLNDHMEPHLKCKVHAAGTSNINIIAPVNNFAMNAINSKNTSNNETEITQLEQMKLICGSCRNMLPKRPRSESHICDGELCKNLICKKCWNKEHKRCRMCVINSINKVKCASCYKEIYSSLSQKKCPVCFSPICIRCKTLYGCCSDICKYEQNKKDNELFSKYMNKNDNKIDDKIDDEIDENDDNIDDNIDESDESDDINIDFLDEYLPKKSIIKASSNVKNNKINIEELFPPVKVEVKKEADVMVITTKKEEPIITSSAEINTEKSLIPPPVTLLKDLKFTDRIKNILLSIKDMISIFE